MAEGNGIGNGNGTAFLSRYSAIIQTVTIVALVIGGFWGAVIMPMRDQIQRLEDTRLTRQEHLEFTKRQDDTVAVLRADTDKKFDLDRIRIERIENGLVPRSENETHWRDEVDRIKEVGDRLAEVRSQVAGTYTIGDQLKALQKQLDDLRVQETRSK